MGGFFLRAFLILLTLQATQVMAQDKGVNSTAFRLLLKGLLKNDVSEITVDSLAQIAKSQNNGIHFIDAREKAEYEVSHLEGATWVGYNDFDMSRLKNITKSDTLIVYCSIGKRSEDITRKLQDAGYNASNLYGGIFEWVNRENPVFQKGIETEKIHGYNKVWSIWLNKGEVVYE